LKGVAGNSRGGYQRHYQGVGLDLGYSKIEGEGEGQYGADSRYEERAPEFWVLGWTTVPTFTHSSTLQRRAEILGHYQLIGQDHGRRLTSKASNTVAATLNNGRFPLRRAICEPKMGACLVGN
jgi:hypothetical protein